MTTKFGTIAAAVLATIVLANAAIPASAQDFGTPASQEPPYDAQLLRLSEILGAIQYLRRLCDSDEGSLWRDQMQAIIDAEAPNPIRRARIVDRFNLGFEGFRSVYRTCTPAAIDAIGRYMEEGTTITRDITVRYGE